jgi:hypothetical protein
MKNSAGQQTAVLNLRPEEVVEVRSEAEILATLDANGRLDGLPFMPEMLAFCGKQFRVYKRSDKTCDTITKTGSRRMWNVVHLEELRCDGSAHDGCQARCLLFWKEAWLKRVRPSFRHQVSTRLGGLFAKQGRDAGLSGGLTPEALRKTTHAGTANNGAEKTIYSCQATELLRASEPLPWWDVRQYYRDVCWGNINVFALVRAVFFWAFKKTLRIGAYRLQLATYNGFQKMHGGVPYPFLSGKLTKTPTEHLDLKVGELVQVKSHEEILATLDHRNRNRGLYFDAEMVPFCGGEYRVLDRVERIVNENNGEMVTLPGSCIMLEGVACRAWYSDRRIACPRSISAYWREIWLKRAEQPQTKAERSS